MNGTRSPAVKLINLALALLFLIVQGFGFAYLVVHRNTPPLPELLISKKFEVGAVEGMKRVGIAIVPGYGSLLMGQISGFPNVAQISGRKSRARPTRGLNNRLQRNLSS